MASFLFYDLLFLALFTLITIIFLYKRRSNLKRQGLLYLYRTRIGLKFIDWAASRYRKILKPMQYVIIASGYFLMVAMIWFTFKIISLYSKPEIIRAIKIPPIIPLFPYVPKVFNLDFLPPFYFTYWIIIIAIIAVSHEFAHGIFARLNKIKVHSTGFGFLGPFLAAFVEPDEKEMNRAKKFPQLSILAAGTFANVLMAILFGLILWLFFAVSFVPIGINFNSYATNVVNLEDIKTVSGKEITNLEEIPAYAEEGLTEIIVLIEPGLNNQLLASEEFSFLILGENLKKAVNENAEQLIVYENAPAINADLGSPILEINNKGITDPEVLRKELSKYNPGDRIEIKTIDGESKEEKTIELVLGNKGGKAYLGIGFLDNSREGISGKILDLVAEVKDPFVYYSPRYNGDLAWFIYNLLWWIVLINFSVALINMLPVGIFDGGRFFYLTVWGITGKESWGRHAFAFATWIIILIVIWLMFQWAIAIY